MNKSNKFMINFSNLVINTKKTSIFWIPTTYFLCYFYYKDTIIW